MLNHKFFIIIPLAFILAICALTFIGCASTKETVAKDNLTQENTGQDCAIQDNINNRVAFGKKYYYLGYEGYTQNEYYTLNEDGTATYTHIIQSGDKTTFHQVINFKWSYAGEGKCILIHNGTKMIKGEQNDAFGISRVMHIGKDISYWSASGENTYYICEDYASQIPNYAKLI